MTECNCGAENSVIATDDDIVVLSDNEDCQVYEQTYECMACGLTWSEVVYDC